MNDDPGRSRRTRFPGFEALAGDSDALIERLVARRRALGLSQTDVAARMGTSQSAVARLEAARSDTRVSTLERYATALGSSLYYAVGDEEER
jgi:transcriptional regulator with XRE-family HTH domain